MKNLMFLATFVFLFLSSTSCDETRQVLNTGSRVELNGSYNVDTVNGAKVNNQQTISFSGIGKTVTGNAGCNTFNAPFTVETFQLSIGDLALTRKACNDMKPENNFIAALGSVSSYQKTDGTLTLLDASGKSVITAKSAN